MSSDDHDVGYEVGYKKAPKHTQWKKGQSGNPSGKKKKDEAIADKLRKVLKQEIILNQNGSPVAMQHEEAMIHALVRKVINKGDTSAFKALIDVLGTQNGADETSSKVPITDADIAVLERHGEWLGIVEEARARLAEDSDDHQEEGVEHDAD